MVCTGFSADSISPTIPNNCFNLIIQETNIYGTVSKSLLRRVVKAGEDGSSSYICVSVVRIWFILIVEYLYVSYPTLLDVVKKHQHLSHLNSMFPSHFLFEGQLRQM